MRIFLFPGEASSYQRLVRFVRFCQQVNYPVAMPPLHKGYPLNFIRFIKGTLFKKIFYNYNNKKTNQFFLAGNSFYL